MGICINLHIGSCECRRSHRFVLPVPEVSAWVTCELSWRGTPGDTLQILTPGHTYNRSYWNFPHRPELYSFVESAVQAGYATLAYDRIGTGESPVQHRTMNQLSVHLQALVLNRIVDAVRGGSIPGFRRKFKRVISIGHSLGSSIALRHAGLFPGSVDKLILTGTMRDLNPEFAGIPAHSAIDDIKFTASSLPSWVITSQPGARDLFYSVDTSESEVRYIDEGLKDVGTGYEIQTIAQAYDPTYMERITVPALYVIGSDDFLFCSSSSPLCTHPDDIVDRLREQDVLPNASEVKAVVIDGAGHSLNLHTSAQRAFQAINDGSVVD